MADEVERERRRMLCATETLEQRVAIANDFVKNGSVIDTIGIDDMSNAANDAYAALAGADLDSSMRVDTSPTAEEWGPFIIIQMSAGLADSAYGR